MHYLCILSWDGSTKNTIEFDKTALNALALFQAAAPASFFEQQRQVANLPPEKGVYTAAVVVALMIMQRLVQGKGTLSGAVQQLLSGALGELLPGHKRVQEDTVSSNTGAYSRARKRLPPAVAEGVSDRVAEYLLADRKEALPGLGRQAFLLDGSSINLAHTAEILAVYPAASNQYGDSHWPVMRVAVAHDLVSGIAMRPAYGPMYGDEAVSEQALAEQIINRVAGGSILVLDRNFGTFAVSWDAHRNKHDFVVRLTDARARSLLNGNLPQQADQWVDWIPSRWDRKAHPHLPADACLRLRFLSTQLVHKGQRIQLYLLTTLDLDRQQIVQLYGFRWQIELDLSSLKQTADLHSLRATTPAMAAKELVLAVTSYNFIRAAIHIAAQAAQIDPRRISFSRAQDVVNACLPNLRSAGSQQEYDRELAKILRRIAQCKLPQTSHRPSYPRAVWYHTNAFPKNKPRRQVPEGTKE